MAVISKGQTFSTGDQVTAGKLNNLADNATFASGAVDNVSTQLSGGSIIVKDGGVTAAKLATDSVETVKIVDGAVTTAKIADSNVTFAKLTDVIDDDTMATATDTTLATSESIKAYVDSSPNFTPSTYNGEESVTLPNGLIMKFGRTAATSSDTTVTFGTQFPTALVSVIGIQEFTSNAVITTSATIGSTFSTSAVNFRHNSSADYINWQAIGY